MCLRTCEGNEEVALHCRQTPMRSGRTRTSPVLESNQWEMSVPAASMMGCTSGPADSVFSPCYAPQVSRRDVPGFASTSDVRSTTLPRKATHKSSGTSCLATCIAMEQLRLASLPPMLGCILAQVCNMGFAEQVRALTLCLSAQACRQRICLSLTQVGLKNYATPGYSRTADSSQMA